MKFAWILPILISLAYGFNPKQRMHRKLMTKTDKIDRAIENPPPETPLILDGIKDVYLHHQAQLRQFMKENPGHVMKTYHRPQEGKGIITTNGAHKKKHLHEDKLTNRKHSGDERHAYKAKKGGRKGKLDKKINHKEKMIKKVDRKKTHVTTKLDTHLAKKHTARKTWRHNLINKESYYKQKLHLKQLKNDDLLAIRKTKKHRPRKTENRRKKNHRNRNKMRGCYRKEPCPLVQRSVCGTDGKTYVNKCTLRIAACMKGDRDSVRIDYMGACKQ